MPNEVAILIILLLVVLGLLSAQNIYYASTIDKLEEKIENIYKLLGGKE